MVYCSCLDFLYTYQENDPAEIQRVNDMVKQARDAANVWTDNGKS